MKMILGLVLLAALPVCAQTADVLIKPADQQAADGIKASFDALGPFEVVTVNALTRFNDTTKARTMLPDGKSVSEKPYATLFRYDPSGMFLAAKFRTPDAKLPSEILSFNGMETRRIMVRASGVVITDDARYPETIATDDAKVFLAQDAANRAADLVRRRTIVAALFPPTGIPWLTTGPKIKRYALKKEYPITLEQTPTTRLFESGATAQVGGLQARCFHRVLGDWGVAGKENPVSKEIEESKPDQLTWTPYAKRAVPVESYWFAAERGWIPVRHDSLDDKGRFTETCEVTQWTKDSGAGTWLPAAALMKVSVSDDGGEYIPLLLKIELTSTWKIRQKFTADDFNVYKVLNSLLARG